MSMQIELGDTDLILNLSGLTMVSTLRKTIKIPYHVIAEVQARSFKFPLTAIKRTGITTASHKAGLFIIDSKKYFLSYHDGNQVVILRLNDFEFDTLVIENGDPAQLEQNILKHCAHINQ